MARSPGDGKIWAFPETPCQRLLPASGPLTCRHTPVGEGKDRCFSFLPFYVFVRQSRTRVCVCVWCEEKVTKLNWGHKGGVLI